MSTSKFVWVEPIVGKNRRNKLIRIADFQVQSDQEQFLSRYIYSDSTGHLLGGLLLSPMYFDFDDAENTQRAQAQAKQCVHYFLDCGVEESKLKIRWTGGKGFSVEVPFTYFGVKPWTKKHGERLNLYWKEIARHLKNKHDWNTLDEVVYDRRRMWRITNTRHSKTGLYKIPITLEDLEGMTVNEIKHEARNMKYSVSHHDTSSAVLSLEAIPALVVLFEEAKRVVDLECRRNKKTFKSKVKRDDWDENKIFPCVVARIENGVDLQSGQFRRQPTGFLIAVALKSLGAPDDVIEDRLHEFFDNCKPPLDKDRRDADIPNIIRSINKTDYSTHCQTPCFENLCVEGGLKSDCWIFTDVVSVDTDDGAFLQRRENFTEEEIAEALHRLEGDVMAFIELAMADIFLEDKLKMPLFILELATENVRISGESATGKSHIADAVMNCFPLHWWKKITGGSSKFLRYLPKQIRTLYVAEFAAFNIGQGDKEAVAEYDMKIMMSEGMLRIPIVEKVDGRLKLVMKETRVENFITTTTDVQAFDELETRQWNLGTDRTISVPFIFWRAKEMESLPWKRLNRKEERRILRCAMSVLDDEAPKQWVVPFMTQVLEPLERVGTPRIRRDVEKLEKFIGAVGRLHYKRRPILEGPGGEKVGIALPEDFYYAIKWGDEAIFSTIMELTKLETQYWNSVMQLHNAHKVITSGSLGSVMNKTAKSAKRWLNKFVNRGRLVEAERIGRNVIYEVVDPESGTGMDEWEVSIDALMDYTEAKCKSYGLTDEQWQNVVDKQNTDIPRTVSLAIPAPPKLGLTSLPDAKMSTKQALQRLQASAEIDANLDWNRKNDPDWNIMTLRHKPIKLKITFVEEVKDEHSN